jgi:DNA polymerase III epsilon subunit family exonuclease
LRSPLLPSPPPSGVEGAVEALLDAAGAQRPVEISIEDSGDAVAAGAIVLALAARLGIPAPRLQGDLFDAVPARPRLRVEIQGGRLGIPEGGAGASIRPPRGGSLSGAALSLVGAAAHRGALDYPSEFVAFDFETTGRDPWADEIIEIGAVRFAGGAEVGAYSTFVKPRGPIPEEITGITGITEGMVRDAPAAPDALRGLLGFCGGLVLVAHNAPFDLAFLRQQTLLGLGREAVSRAEDTLFLSRWLHPDAPGHRLGDMARLLGIALEGWHRAVNDARAAALLYLALLREGAEALPELRVREQLDLAALGTLASGLPLEGVNGLLVTHGIRMAARTFGLQGCTRAERMHPPPTPRAAAGMLLSLDDRVRQRAALHLLAPAVSPR